MYKDLTNKSFGRLTALSIIPNERPTKWLCVCSCGNTKVVRSCHLLSGSIQSCGCLLRDTTSNRNKTTKVKHNKTGSRLYHIWRGIKLRCYNKNSTDYYRYGGAGVTVCDEWLNSFENFYLWAINSGYEPNLTIDRIDNSKGYCPSNCKWSTCYEQTRNRKNTILLQYHGAVHTLNEWSIITGIPYSVLWYRLFRAKIPWSIEDALEHFEIRDEVEEELNVCEEEH